MEQISTERDELEMTLRAKMSEIDRLKDKCFEMEEEQHILEV